MTIEFKYGFEFEGFLFGWHKKELYRLPSLSSDGKKLSIKKLKLHYNINSKSYRIKSKKIPVDKCVAMTLKIEDAIKMYKEKNKI